MAATKHDGDGAGERAKRLLAAVGKVHRLLEPLDDDARVRVLHAAAITFELETALRERLGTVTP